MAADVAAGCLKSRIITGLVLGHEQLGQELRLELVHELELV